MSPPTETSTTSATMVGSNEDLLTEILTHLPIRPILRFKTVNKQWHTTISHPSFTLLHSLRHPHPPPSSLLLHHHHHHHSLFHIPLLRRPPPLPPPPPSDLVHSSNGLFLSLSLSPFPSPLFHLLVSNPTIPHFQRIFSGSTAPFLPSTPPAPGPGPPGRSHSSVSVQHPGSDQVSGQLSASGQGSGHVVTSGQGPSQVIGSGPGQGVGSGEGECEVVGWGEGEFEVDGMDQEQVGVSLGFDPGRWAHYFVVRVFKRGSDRLFMDVYESRRGTWQESRACLDDAPFDTEFERGVYWEGRVFWLSHTGSMVYYELENDVVGRLVLPKVFDQGSYLERFRYFGESCGHLHLVEIRTNCVREFDVLELEETQGGVFEWFVKFRVDLDLVGRGFEDDMFQDGADRFGRQLRFYAFSILAVIRGVADDGKCDYDDDGQSCAQLVLSIPGKVISYNFEEKVSRLLCNVVDESDKWLPFRGYNAFQFIESLYCP